MKKMAMGKFKFDPKKKPLYIGAAIGLLIILFLVSFWATGLILKLSQGTLFAKYDDGHYETSKPTYEQLEKMVEERDAKIASLEIELERYRSQGNDTELAPSTLVPETPEITEEPETEPAETPTETPETETPEEAE